MTNPPDDLAKTNLRYRSDLFAIRLWREGAGEGAQWRGQLEHAASGQTHDFHDWDSFMDGLNTLTGEK
ncbi:MAG: hypothetical protein KA765_00885 [Thermoflexales bacterium]|nr:hypothetical protein [Thermoflexales bacterium]